MNEINIINFQLDFNEGQTYFGGKDGYDYVCFDRDGKIVCSGRREEMLHYGDRDNLAVAILIPVRFATSK